ncbi:YbjN domain-containing protein [Streptomyces clavuligerus]|uniref:DUF2596 domain-containing protein n=1 Tax=Streptomyces clavuligerus TaxID=1901 RepID=E2PYV4_STRCL|nr:YbjN domain-containing protein [Streptomyces clavuligerus]ANW19001.1 hypothetical protein BB341_12530 [Streptomyces clavuligerus]AXU13583.1 YbjN domain-containing protein [Streptomyces clavuligerus]EFG08285.1 DUF2596 domain-containing protein [Streptomyces clavuligerus]QCS06367.1 YbjN domain-containing protein [Streptomyces clavuligerus]QPJ94283.1 YbjN domain-containing protein [Streptomyces clavuligerus]
MSDPRQTPRTPSVPEAAPASVLGTEAAVGAAAVVERALTDAGLVWERPEPGSYVVTLPGTRKLSTTCSLRIGRHSLSLNAFVIRHPDENEAAVHRWLLERNLRLYGVNYAIDHLGDIYLTGRLPLSVATPEELDRLLGAVLEASDGAFNTLLELGFAEAIRREYAWRTARGESTRNLAAFTHLTKDVQSSGG